MKEEIKKCEEFNAVCVYKDGTWQDREMKKNMKRNNGREVLSSKENMIEQGKEGK